MATRFHDIIEVGGTYGWVSSLGARYVARSTMERPLRSFPPPNPFKRRMQPDMAAVAPDAYNGARS